MTDNDFGEDRDPLLVRPFLLNDSGALGDDPSTQTWPAATTREVRSHHASADDDPTGPLPPAVPRRNRRRLLVIGTVIVAVVLVAAAAGFAALRPGMRPSISTALPDSPLPMVTGPTTAGATPSAASTAATSHRAKPAATTVPPSPTSTSADGTGSGHSPATAGGQTTAASAASAQRAAPTASVGAIRGENGLCLDLLGGVAADDTPVLVAICTGGSTQRWTVATDGTLQVAGECALVVGDDTVHIVACDGRKTAQWRVSGSTLINAADSKCLTDPAKGTLPGTLVTVTRCTDAANQQWSLP